MLAWKCRIAVVGHHRREFVGAQSGLAYGSRNLDSAMDVGAAVSRCSWILSCMSIALSAIIRALTVRAVLSAAEAAKASNTINLSKNKVCG